MPRYNHIYGQTGESLAAAYLVRRGYRILERNFRTPLGEIDIVARHRGVVVFVEVKTRRSESFASAKLAVNAQKQRKISVVALAYLKGTRQLDQKARFDVVTIVNPAGTPKIELICNAFDFTC